MSILSFIHYILLPPNCQVPQDTLRSPLVIMFWPIWVCSLLQSKKARNCKTHSLTFQGNSHVRATWISAVHNLHYCGAQSTDTWVEGTWNTSLCSFHRYTLSIYFLSENCFFFTQNYWSLHTGLMVYEIWFKVAVMKTKEYQHMGGNRITKTKTLKILDSCVRADLCTLWKQSREKWTLTGKTKSVCVRACVWAGMHACMETTAYFSPLGSSLHPYS